MCAIFVVSLLMCGQWFHYAMSVQRMSKTKRKRTIKRAAKPSKLDPKRVKAAVKKLAVPELDWMRAKRDETICAKRRTWESRCRQYKVVESVGKFTDMGTHYYAIFKGDGFERIISRHRKRGPAEKACEKYAKQASSRKRRS